MSGRGHLLPLANVAEQVLWEEGLRLVTSTLFPSHLQMLLSKWRDYEWWVDIQHANCQDTSCLHKPAATEEAGLLSNGNWDYWDRRQADDVEEEDEVML